MCALTSASRAQRSSHRLKHRLCALIWAGYVAAARMSLAQTPDLNNASLEDLMNIKVTSVDKKDQKMSQAGAAVYVISQEDIRRSGMHSIPDLLRIVPGVDVAQIDSHTWAISIRGFNYQYATKVLVLIDGRTVYSPLFSGVFWDMQDVPLEDIERIEVIRGPGGTVWGANAVNGVINIITKSSKQTQGELLVAGTGTEQCADTLLEYGGTAGQAGTYRIFGRYFQNNGSHPANGVQGDDGWHGSHGGFRSDWDLSSQDELTVQGDFFGTSEAQPITTLISTELPDLFTFNDKAKSEAEIILTRWKHTFSDGSGASLQLYYDRNRRSDQGTAASLNTGDFDFQYHFQAGARNDLVAGGGYRILDLNFTSGYSLGYNVNHRTENLFNVFVQDEVRISKSVTLTVGSKFEHNSFTGFEYEPSAQLVWTPSRHQTVWSSVSRAIRQPALFDTGLIYDAATLPLPGAGFGLIQILGGKTDAETLVDFEAGYRAELSRRVSIDVTLFSSRYRHLETSEPGTPYFTLSPGPPHFVLPYHFSDLSYANDYGVEFFARWNPGKRWQISPGYSYLDMNLKFNPTSQDTFDRGFPGLSPKHQFQVRSNLNLPHHMEWDASLYYVSELWSGPVPAYARLDTRVGWHTGESVEFSVSAQNLLAPRHVEFWTPFPGVIPTYAQRSIFAKITYRF
jgi:iron complex outermembrane recepter protein